MQAMENVKTNILTELLKKSWYFDEKWFRKKPHFWLACLQTDIHNQKDMYLNQTIPFTK